MEVYIEYDCMMTNQHKQPTVQLASLVASLLVLLLLVACSANGATEEPQVLYATQVVPPTRVSPTNITPTPSVQPSVTPTPTPLPTPTPTAIPIATPTPKPTPTRVPTPTATAIPTPTATPPPIKLFIDLIEPLDNSVISSESLVLSGRSSPDATISVNGLIIDNDEDGNFTTTINLIEGINLLEIIASDVVGDQETMVITIAYIPENSS